MLTHHSETVENGKNVKYSHRKKTALMAHVRFIADVSEITLEIQRNISHMLKESNCQLRV